MSDHQKPTNKVSDHPFIRNSDGTITRLFNIPSSPATADPTSPSPALSKDVPLNPHHQTWLRLFLPHHTKAKLPILVYFHGGGFVMCSAASTFFHDFCVHTAAQLRVLIVSLEYRLAPEHRLPAAYDDAMEALHWIRSSHDDWLTHSADISSCFLMGTSAGANMAYHVGLRAASDADDLAPLAIRGLVLHHPFFGGSERTESELRLSDDKTLPMSVIDQMWELSLPLGADRDHEYSNPTIGDRLQSCDMFKAVGWRVMVTGCDGDPLIDRQMALVTMLEGKDVHVVSRFDEWGYHGVELFDSSKAMALCLAIKDFMSYSGTA